MIPMITLGEFVKNEHERLEKFKEYWEENQNNDDLEDWPDTLTEEEWIEQIYDWFVLEGDLDD